jgi:outer membrane protein assembly factor BamB
VTVPANPDLSGQLVAVGGELVITAIPETGPLRVALTALRLSDGRHQWSQTISSPAEKLTMSALAGLSASAKVVAVVVGVTVYGLSPVTGKVLWHYRLGENDPGAGVVVGDTVLIGGRNIGQAFHAFDAATGRSRWQAPVEEFNTTSLASDGRTVYVLDSQSPGLQALDVLSGQRRWQRPAIGGSETWGPVGGILYVISETDAMTLALNATTGKTLWRKDGRAAPTFAATRSTAFVVMSDDKGNKQTIKALRSSGA